MWSMIVLASALHASDLDMEKVENCGVVQILKRLEKQEDPSGVTRDLLRLSLLVDSRKHREIRNFLHVRGDAVLLTLANNDSPFLVRMFATVVIALLLNHEFLKPPINGLNKTSSYIVEQMLTVICELANELTCPELSLTSPGIAEAGATAILKALSSMLGTGWISLKQLDRHSLKAIVNILKCSVPDNDELRNTTSEFLASSASHFRRPIVKTLMSVDIMGGILRLVEHTNGLEGSEPCTANVRQLLQILLSDSRSAPKHLADWIQQVKGCPMRTGVGQILSNDLSSKRAKCSVPK